MQRLKIWPVFVSILICGCSIQQQTDRAERVWLKESATQPMLHDVSLRPSKSVHKQDQHNAFITASGAATVLRGKIQSPQIRELSGLAAVLGQKDKFWAINDSGNRPQLFALGGNGKQLGATNLPLQNRDWEDLASFYYSGENWIAIAETGDNLERHSVSSIYIFKQPDLSDLPAQLKLFKRIDFRYPNGPRNVESMAISPDEGRIYFIAKDYSAPDIYTLPLDVVLSSKSGEIFIAEKAGQLARLFSTKKDVWWERSFAARILYEPTAADISADNRTAVVANYRHVYLFKRQGSESWASAFSRKPEILSSHRMQQSEALAFAASSSEVIVSSEGRNALMLAVRPISLPGSRNDASDNLSGAQ